MRARWAVALTAALTVLLGGAAGGASATDPVTLGDGYVLDDVGCPLGERGGAGGDRGSSS